MPSVVSFCSICQRTVYIGEQDDRACPVCSTPLMVTEIDPARVDRIVKNEALFRNVNERVAAISADGPQETGQKEGYICECGAKECSQLIYLTRDEYETIRAAAAKFVILKGHEIPEVERIVEERDGYHIIEKIGRSKAAARRTHPRAP